MDKENLERIEKWKEEVKELKEHELFLYIETISGIKWRENHDYSDGRLEMPEKDFLENQEYYGAMLTESTKMLPKFGIDPESVKDGQNGDYWKWYNFWKEWMEAFSDDGWKELNKKMVEEQSIDDLLPKKKWNDPVEEPVSAEKEEKKG